MPQLRLSRQSQWDFICTFTVMTDFLMFQLFLSRWLREETTSVLSQRRTWRKPRRNSMKILLTGWELWRPFVLGLNNNHILDAKQVRHKCTNYMNPLMFVSIRMKSIRINIYLTLMQFIHSVSKNRFNRKYFHNAIWLWSKGGWKYTD